VTVLARAACTVGRRKGSVLANGDTAPYDAVARSAAV
jgi:hypothetical protein